MNKGAVCWQRHVAAIRREGISTSAYAKRHRIAVKRLYYWQRKAAAATAGGIQPGTFVALRVEPSIKAPALASCTVVLATGVRLEMCTLPSPEWLAALSRDARSVLMHPGSCIEQVYLCRQPIDFRKSIDGLSVLVEQALEMDPFGNALYVVVNRQRTKIKALYWHRNGFCLWQKRLTMNNAIAAANAIKREAQDYVQRMLEQRVLARHRLFGVSSEQHTGQARLFDEAEVLVQATTASQDIAAIPAQTPAPEDGNDKTATKPARGKRSPLPAELKRVEVVHEVPEDERTCPCGTPMVEIGQEVSEQLDIVPMQLRVLRHIRKRYGCPSSLHAPVTAALPPQPLPKSNASADFLAMLLTVKFVDGLPLARFEYVLDRHGVPVPRQTLARWVIGAGRLLQPLHNLLRDTLTDGPFLHVVETVVQVLKEDGKTPTSTSYMGVQTGGPPGKPVVLYDYDPSRSGQVPVRLLEGYRGYLMTDGYEGYNALAAMDGIEQLACWAHVRRRFVDAARVQPRGRRGQADEAVALIGTLYGIEREYKEADDTVRFLARQQHSVPPLEALRTWLTKTQPGVTPKGALGTALAYLQKYWSRLVRYTERGDLPIDNNRCENAIRPFVVGRKAWLFSDTPAGATASAVIYSLVQTAKANGLEPYTWLRRVMRDLPKAKTVDEMEALLPWNLKALQTQK